MAAQAGLKLGDEIQPTHGIGGDGHKHDGFKVVGILKPTGTANDRAVFINIEGFYRLEGHALAEEESADGEKGSGGEGEQADEHKHEEDHADEHKHDEHADENAGEHKHDEHGDAHKVGDEHAHADEHEHEQHEAKETASAGAESAGLAKPPADGEHEEAHDEHKHGDEHDAHEHGEEHKHDAHDEGKEGEHAHDEHEHHHHGHIDEPLPIDQREVTSILVLCKPNPLYSMALDMGINKGKDRIAQAVAPAREVAMLMNTIVGPLRIVLLVLTVLVVIVAGISILVSIYNSMNERSHDIAVMRALGASRNAVMAIVLVESILLALLAAGSWVCC